VQIGAYRLGARLGEGASGVVYRARSADGTEVVLKVLRPEKSDDAIARARFEREARIARGIDSRHVAPILELGEADGQTFLVLPLYAGGSLAQKLRDAGRLTVAQTVDLAAQLGRGIDALHDREILHRDVKPSNVLLDADGVAVVTEDGQVVGTAHYLAPELIEGRDATRASDVYALGCVLYECLVGRPPFEGRGPAEIGFAHLVEPPVDPCDLRPELPADVGAALLTALAKEPSERPPSATALARMLHVAGSVARS
jgi:eukaryotic-like serine/threonine-protein kinase